MQIVSHRNKAAKRRNTVWILAQRHLNLNPAPATPYYMILEKLLKSDFLSVDDT
jgi:hypothetical protein